MGKKIALATWLVGIGAAALAGFQIDPYLAKRIPPPQPYPLETLAWVALLVSAHVLLLLAVLRPASFRASWRRAAGASLVSAGFLGLGIYGGMHAPPPWAAYLWGLLAVLAGMLVLFGWSVVAAVRSRAGT